MTPLLILHTSGALPMVGVLTQEKRVAVSGAASESHNESLAGLMEDALHQAGIDRSHIEGVVVGSGPGSFTGLRIGFGYAKGLALGLHVPLYVSDTFEAFALEAFQSTQKALQIVVEDARRKELFVRAFLRGEMIVSEHPFSQMSIQASSDMKVLKSSLQKNLQISEEETLVVSLDGSLLSELGEPFIPKQSPCFLGDLVSKHQIGKTEVSVAEPWYVRSVMAKTIVERGIIA